jgi:eukaryotic-like serine/threonine-protein kinase
MPEHTLPLTPDDPDSTISGRPGESPEDSGITAGAPPFCAPVLSPGGPTSLLGLPGPGQRLDDFDLVRVLGAGSFAKVFLARQVSLGRHVALKVSLNRGNEARTLASLEHDHIVRVFSEVVDSQRDLRMLCMQSGHHPGAHHRDPEGPVFPAQRPGHSRHRR